MVKSADLDLMNSIISESDENFSPPPFTVEEAENSINNKSSTASLESPQNGSWHPSLYGLSVPEKTHIQNSLDLYSHGNSGSQKTHNVSFSCEIRKVKSSKLSPISNMEDSEDKKEEDESSSYKNEFKSSSSASVSSNFEKTSGSDDHNSQSPVPLNEGFEYIASSGSEDKNSDEEFAVEMILDSRMKKVRNINTCLANHVGWIRLPILFEMGRVR